MSTKPSYSELIQEVESLRAQLAAARDTISSFSLGSEHGNLEQQRFHTVLSSIPEGVYIVNPGYGIEYVNPVLRRDFGPINGRKCFEYLHGRTEPCPDCKNKDVFAGKSVRRQWHSEKNNKYYVIYDSPLKNVKGTLDKLAFFHDATTVRQVTEALAQSQQLLDGVINNSTAVIYVKDIQGRYLMANTRFSDLFNEDGHGIPGKRDVDFFPADQARLLLENDQNVLLENDVCQFEETLRHRDGNHVYISIKFPLVDSDDSVYAVATIATDITERKESELELLTKNEWLTALINASPDIICLKDGQGRWLQANQADLHVFRLAGVDYKGKTDAELAPYSNLHEETFRACMESDEEAWRKGAPVEDEKILPMPDGENKIYAIVKVPLFYPDGARRGLVVLGHDITALRKLEQRLRQELAARREAFQTVREKSKELEETNIALRVLLNQQKMADEDMQQRILFQLEKAVFPYIDLLRQCLLDEHGNEYLDIISDHLQVVGESFMQKLSSPGLGLTQREILVADLVRQGKSTKEIAKLLGLLPRSVEAYRNKIRKKLHLNRKNISLKQYLTTKFTS